jgi:hypothetical protein
MKAKLIGLVVMSLLVMPALAEKPAWAGKGKPTAEQKEMHRAAMEAKGDDMDMDESRLKEKKEKKEKKQKKEKSSDTKGLEKQREMKTEQEQKELGKGSEKGQKSREENSKKWWKFWEE